MIYSILFVILASISYWYWRHKYLPAEVAQNAAAIKANGAADDLQVPFHQREFWSRVWPGLACCLPPPLPLLFGEGGGGWGAAALAFAATAALLLGVFVRDFTPKLNLARIANGDTWLSEWFCSLASKSWPDAAAAKKTRKQYPAATDEQLAALASKAMRQLVIRTWRLCLAASFALAAGAIVVSL